MMRHRTALVSLHAALMSAFTTVLCGLVNRDLMCVPLLLAASCYAALWLLERQAPCQRELFWRKLLSLSAIAGTLSILAIVMLRNGEQFASVSYALLAVISIQVNKELPFPAPQPS